ncbi:hypothetical protein Pla8534_50020 [Lignipirellula cremea]|uniref:Right handed beta helix domain-containing protein n=2 Tax=Lignipirellula cremea TaxID=2528010 RepID=A0A518DZ84_9BACT|nr:hypothetical protein Pla8534_50020 [Lignipirellula cremea]
MTAAPAAAVAQNAPYPGAYSGPAFDPYASPEALGQQMGPQQVPFPQQMLPQNGYTQQIPPMPGGINWNSFMAPIGVTPRAGVGGLFGEDVGLGEGYGWSQAFMPLFQTPGMNLTYVDVQALKYFQQTDAFGYNAALGHRWFNVARQRVYGVYASYDYQNTGDFDFNQVSFGFESLGQLWDVRANGYLVLGDQEQLVSVENLQYQQNNLVGTANYLDAYSGFDAEIGRNLTPKYPFAALRIFAGVYGFYASNGDDLIGARGRVEATLWDRVIVGGSIQCDPEYNTTANGTISILFGGGGSGQCDCPTIASRLGDPLHKNRHVVLGDRQENFVALNPTDNQPLQFLHIDSNAAAGGTGTFEAPLNTLTDPAASTDIVLLHAGSLFTGQAITLGADGQRLLGDSAAIRHTAATQFGNVPLPRANALSASPQIDLAPGGGPASSGPGAVTIAANNVEVSGLTITRPQGDGIYGNAVTGVNINRNTISAALDDGVDLDGNVSGQIRNNTVSAGVGGSADGLELETFTDGVIDSNTAIANGGYGFRTASFTGGQFTNNTATANTTGGFLFTNASGGTISNNMATGNGADGFAVDNFTGGEFSTNTASGNGVFGFRLGNLAGGQFNNNTSSGNGSFGFRVSNASGGLFSNNTATGATIAGFDFSLIQGTAVIDANTASANTGNGFNLNNGFDTGTFSNNIANNNTGQGYINTLDPVGATPRTVTNNTGAGNAGGDTFNGP